MSNAIFITHRQIFAIKFEHFKYNFNFNFISQFSNNYVDMCQNAFKSY